MAKNLVIVESPAKAKTINKYLGNEYIVKASMGHIRDLPEKGLGVDIENKFEPTYEVTKTRIKTVSELKAAAKTAEKIYLCPDPDREGEAIAWHLSELLGGRKNPNFFRVTFNEITKDAIRTAFQHAGPIDMNRVDAQQARRVLDRIAVEEAARSPQCRARAIGCGAIDRRTRAGDSRVQGAGVLVD